MTSNLPAIRNFNPGNLEYNPHDPFLGLANPPNDGKWCRFVDGIHGIRAIMVVLHTDIVNHNLTTVAQIMSRYAPASENNVPAYIAAICSWMGINENDELDVDSGDMYIGFSQAIAIHESGVNPDGPKAWYSDSDYEQAYQLTPFAKVG